MKRRFYLKQVRKNSLLLLIPFILIFSAACRKEIDRDTLVRIYVENVIIEEGHSNNLELMKKKKIELYKKYNTTEEKYANQLKEIGKNRDEWKEFFKKANEILDEYKKSGAIN